ncbi:MAG TPA: hypothetical protein VHL30_01490 [Chlamydiales bacterium]|jgi:hypothetical protein|nr:hypothetical protein [Chlamydiales bacterium]
MKKLQVRNGLLFGAIAAALFACQPTQKSSKMAPCSGDDCPAPPEAPYEDKVPCREDECDEQEAGEEASIHVIEINEPAEQKSEPVVEAPSTPAEEQDIAVEAVPSENLSEQSATDTKIQSQETSASKEINLETPSISEEPTTHRFDDLPSSPISENTIVLSLEE